MKMNYENRMLKIDGERRSSADIRGMKEKSIQRKFETVQQIARLNSDFHLC